MDLGAEDDLGAERAAVGLARIGLHLDECEALLTLEDADFHPLGRLLLLMCLDDLLDLLVVLEETEVLGAGPHHSLGYDLGLVDIELLDVRVLLQLGLCQLG